MTHPDYAEAPDPTEPPAVLSDAEFFALCPCLLCKEKPRTTDSCCEECEAELNRIPFEDNE